jgi:PAS domain-containing protein
MKLLPTGISSFSQLRSRNAVYVDKTPLLYRLMTEGKYYFLSRPRRFGKSLTVSTLAEIYAGNQALFEGLWIADKWDWGKVHPVIQLSFNGMDYKNQSLEAAIIERMHEIAASHGLQLHGKFSPGLFRELIQALAAQQGQVVILIDEYDKPLTDFLQKEDLPKAYENRDTLRDFYGVVKDLDDEIEFFFMTGVSKFSQVNLFSQLNNLTDISLSPRYATLTGYTQEELEGNFGEWIDHAVAQNPGMNREQLLIEIKQWYDGYSFDGHQYVYNPFSILLFLPDGIFQDYWFKTGTPYFLVNMLKERQFFVLNELVLPPAVFESFDLEHIDHRALLFQTGYLTLTFADFKNNRVILDYPNQEVERSLHNHLIGALLDQLPVDAPAPVERLQQAFLADDLPRVIEIINSLLADLPYHLFKGKKEHFYHALVHLHFRYLGLYMDSEVSTSRGRIDAMVQTPERIYVLEFKADESADAALAQIAEKGYADKYRHAGKPIVAVGINFDTEQKKVGEWRAQAL